MGYSWEHGDKEMKYQLEISTVAMAILRRTMREITPTECAERITRVFDSIYLQGKIDQITIDTEKLKELDSSIAKLGTK